MSFLVLLFSCYPDLFVAFGGIFSQENCNYCGLLFGLGALSRLFSSDRKHIESSLHRFSVSFYLWSSHSQGQLVPLFVFSRLLLSFEVSSIWQLKVIFREVPLNPSPVSWQGPGYSLHDLSNPIVNIAEVYGWLVGEWFVIMAVWLYLETVVPSGYGIKKHPLFFLGFGKHKQEYDHLSVVSSIDFKKTNIKGKNGSERARRCQGRKKKSL